MFLLCLGIGALVACGSNEKSSYAQSESAEVNKPAPPRPDLDWNIFDRHPAKSVYDQSRVLEPLDVIVLAYSGFVDGKIFPENDGFTNRNFAWEREFADYFPEFTDEFDRQKVFQKLLKHRNDLINSPLCVFISVNIGEYDFSRGGFPIKKAFNSRPFRDNTESAKEAMNFGSAVEGENFTKMFSRVFIDNIDDLLPSFIAMDERSAKKLIQELGETQTDVDPLNLFGTIRYRGAGCFVILSPKNSTISGLMRFESQIANFSKDVNGVGEHAILITLKRSVFGVFSKTDSSTQSVTDPAEAAQPEVGPTEDE